MFLILLFCVSWVVFFAIMLQMVDQRSNSRAQTSNAEQTHMKPRNHQSVGEVTAESLYLKDWTERHQKDDWARRRLSGIILR